MEVPGRPQCVLESMPLWVPFMFCFQKRGARKGIYYFLSMRLL